VVDYLETGEIYPGKEASASTCVSSAYVIILSCTLLLLATCSFAITGALVLISIWVIIDPKRAVEALVLSLVFRSLNPAIYHYSSSAFVMGWIIIFCAGMRVLPHLGAAARQLGILIPLILFFITIGTLSIFFSYNAAVSILKLVSFTFAFLIILVGFNSQEASLIDEFKKFYFSLIGSLLLLSIPIALLPRAAHYWGAGFQGMFNNPQTLGVYLAPITSWVTADLVFYKRRAGFFHKSFVALLWLAMFLSQCRTGALSVSLSVITMVLVSLCGRGNTDSDYRSKARLAVISLFLFSFIVVSLFLSGFLAKGGKSIEQSVQHSRVEGIAYYWKRFLANPLTGVGFGVEPSRRFKAVEFFGIPISASTEKLFLPVAILEEVGIIGTLFFCILLLALANCALRNPDISLRCVFLSCLLVNLGEFVFFSANSDGLYFLILIGYVLRTSRQDKDVRSYSLVASDAQYARSRVDQGACAAVAFRQDNCRF